MVVRRSTIWVAVLAAAASAAVPVLPFARSGSRVRSGYELIRTAESAGVLPGPTGRVAVVALALLPLLAASALVAGALRRGVVVATLVAMAGLVAAAAGFAVVRAPIPAEVGAWMAIGVGLGTIVAATVLVVKR